MLGKDYNTVEEAVRDFEKELGIRSGFLEELHKEDDWSFTIKAHSFFEAAFTHLLVNITGKETLEDVFSSLELSNAKTGKLAFAKSLGVIDENEQLFVRKFSELRNILVHNIKQVDFDFKEYVSKLDKNQLKSFTKAFSYFAVGETFKYAGEKYDTAGFVRTNPKTAIWFSVMVFAGVLYLKKNNATLQAMVDFLRKQIPLFSTKKTNTSSADISLQTNNGPTL